MSEYIIEMKNITKIFPGIVANDNVTIQIKKGEIYALLGENGAGKSTFLKTLNRMNDLIPNVKITGEETKLYNTTVPEKNDEKNGLRRVGNL